MLISDWSSDVFSSDDDPLVTPDTAPNPLTGAGRFEFLNSAAGCRGYNMHQHTGGSTTAPLAGVCEVDFHGDYIMLPPEIERKVLTAPFTANVGYRAQVSAMANYYQPHPLSA